MKLSILATIMFCGSQLSFAESAMIYNNNLNTGHMIVSYQKCGRPVAMSRQDHLDCLSKIDNVIIKNRTSTIITIERGYFANLTQVVEIDTTGNVLANTHFNSRHQCEVFGSVVLTDDGMGRIICLHND
ncbi:MAG: hypothetical protein ABI597_06765 [Gammaproteobacteria bacterium]